MRLLETRKTATQREIYYSYVKHFANQVITSHYVYFQSHKGYVLQYVDLKGGLFRYKCEAFGDSVASKHGWQKKVESDLAHSTPSQSVHAGYRCCNSELPPRYFLGDVSQDVAASKKSCVSHAEATHLFPEAASIFPCRA